MKNDEILKSKINCLSDCELRAKIQKASSLCPPCGGTRDSGRGVNTAFTLAEVLIVLAIIGIVAALTIPALMTKIQKHEYVVALKKAYTTQMDGWSRLLADEGVQNLEDTSVFQSMPEDYCFLPSGDFASCKSLLENLKKYFRFNVITAPSYRTYYLKGTEDDNYIGRTVLAFADGSVMFGEFYKYASKKNATRNAQIAADGGHMYSNQGSFVIDINGFKKPNTEGRDIFYFRLSGDGKLYPDNGKDDSLFSDGDLSYTWQKQSIACVKPGSTDISDTWGYG